MAKVVFKNVYKRFTKDMIAVDNFNLSIDDEEFIVLVGPSGCGKSTTLRMLAGLEDISEGEIYIDDVLVNNIEPKNRDIAMVFQNYALYPHMSVYDNLAFALKLKKMSKDEIDSRVKNAARILGIENLLNRKPKALSGGQRQRVALGRAIVRNAKVFLMDEPLSNLDAKLRVQTRAEIIKLHKELKTNIIYVTHDQTEAMTMGDRIVVMKDGIIQQIDTPEKIYSYPNNIFVAGFIGSPQMNFFDCRINITKNMTEIKYLDNIMIEYNNDNFSKSYSKDNIILGIRPENLSLCDPGNGNFDTDVTLIENLGSDKLLYNITNNVQIAIRVPGEIEIQEKEHIGLRFNQKDVHLFDSETGERIRI